jgi:4-amino-4-deoxy-L-arabinose transferase-like glycosyltransferase
MPSRETRGWGRDMLLLGLVCAIWYVLFLGVRPLNNPDEGRYTEIPREMAATGDYVTPRLNGVKYFEKPPLVYWLSALTFEVAGVNEFTSRFWNALIALGGVVMTYAAARSLYGRAAGLGAGVVLATSLLYYGLGQLIILDMAVSVAMSAALFAFVLAMREPAGTRRRWLFMAFYASMAVATLSKGLIGFVLPCAVAFFWVLLLNRWRALWPFYPISGTIVLLGLTAPWHVLASLANQSAVKEYDFAWFYFVHEHFLRFTTKIHGRYEPWWFFIPILIGGLFPWVVFGAQAVKRSLGGGWKGRNEHREAWFLVIWIAFIMLFFSKSQSKLIPYVLPVFPAAAVLIGRYIADAWAARTGRGVRGGLWIFVGFACALAVAACFVPLSSRTVIARGDLLFWRTTLAAIFGLGALSVAWSVKRQQIRAALVAVLTTTLGFMLCFNFVAGLVDARSTKPLAMILKPRLQPGDDVYTLGTYTQDLPVYLDRLVSVVDYEGELAFGIEAEPAMSAPRFIKQITFEQRWRGPQVAYAVVSKRNFDRWFKTSALPYTRLGETGQFVLVVNTAQEPSS